MRYGIYDLLWFFVIYAFLGWCAEVIFAALKTGSFVNRGFLNGPVCPIYGAGVAVVVLCLTPLKQNFLLLFAGSVILTSMLEFITGYVLDQRYHEKWWDYSNEKLNLKGYICLRFSLLWGIACIAVLYGIHPVVCRVVSLIPRLPGTILLSLLLALLVTDWIITSSALARFHRKFSILEKAAAGLHEFSDGVGENLAEGAIEMQRKNEGLKSGLERKKGELMEKFQQLQKQPGFTRKRILKAFPHLQSSGRHKQFLRFVEDRKK